MLPFFPVNLSGCSVFGTLCSNGGEMLPFFVQELFFDLWDSVFTFVHELFAVSVFSSTGLKSGGNAARFIHNIFEVI